MLINLHLSNYNYVKYFLKTWEFDNIFGVASKQQLKKKKFVKSASPQKNKITLNVPEAIDVL